MPSNEETYRKVVAVVVESLNVAADEIHPTSTLQGDLGADSIDFFDMLFRLEREFGIKISRRELFPESIFQGNPEHVKGGRLTPQGLEELRAKMPLADLTEFEKDPELSRIRDLFTVQLITRYVESELGKSGGHEEVVA